MMTLDVQRLLNMAHFTLLAGLTLCLMFPKTAAQGCDQKIASAVKHINNYVPHTDSVHELVPYIHDSLSQGDFCNVYPEIRKQLTKLQDECKGSSDIKIYLAKMAGYDFMCNAGSEDYTKHSKCITEMSSKLREKCPIKYSTLPSIRSASLFASDEEKPSICTDIKNYIKCSHDLISKGCQGTTAGDWHQSFLTSVFKYMSDNDQLECSFGEPKGLLESKVANIAIYVAIGVGVLLILFCICWCCRAKVCSCCCKDDDEKDIEYHNPNRSEREMTRVNSVV